MYMELNTAEAFGPPYPLRVWSKARWWTTPHASLFIKATNHRGQDIKHPCTRSPPGRLFQQTWTRENASRVWFTVNSGSLKTGGVCETKTMGAALVYKTAVANYRALIVEARPVMSSSAWRRCYANIDSPGI